MVFDVPSVKVRGIAPEQPPVAVPVVYAVPALMATVKVVLTPVSVNTRGLAAKFWLRMKSAVVKSSDPQYGGTTAVVELALALPW